MHKHSPARIKYELSEAASFETVYFSCMRTANLAVFFAVTTLTIKNPGAIMAICIAFERSFYRITNIMRFFYAHFPAI